jgi:hypothetical protein
MKDVRIGESLWHQWSGSGYYEVTETELIYFTEDHVDMENEIVRRALASALQRDGSAVSLGDGFRMLDGRESLYVYAGEVDGDMDFTVCDSSGETREGDYVDDILEITLVAL